LLRVQWTTSDYGQGNCPKHVEFHSKNKFDKLVHLVDFIIRNFWSYVAQFFLEGNCFRKKKVALKINAYVLCSNYLKKNRAVYDIMWKNTVVPDRPQMTIWRMRIACWIPKATHTLTTCNTYCFSNATMVARTRLIVTFHAPCSCYLCLISPRNLVHCYTFSSVNAPASKV
jgi:hypothetical protein